MTVRFGFAACEGQHWCEIHAGGNDYFNGAGATPADALAAAVAKLHEALRGRLP